MVVVTHRYGQQQPGSSPLNLTTATVVLEYSAASVLKSPILSRFQVPSSLLPPIPSAAKFLGGFAPSQGLAAVPPRWNTVVVSQKKHLPLESTTTIKKICFKSVLLKERGCFQLTYFEVIDRKENAMLLLV